MGVLSETVNREDKTNNGHNMGIKVYISGSCGNKEIENHQHRICMILKSLSIQHETVDIGAPGMDNERDFMREKGTKKEGMRHCLPPQIFNGEDYCGDYDAFDVANEDDELEEFLKIPRKNPKVDPTKTEATEAEVGKLEPGKLEKPTENGVEAPAENGSAEPEAPKEEAAAEEAAAPAEES